MSYLLDTNFISELSKVKPNAGALSFIINIERELLFLSVLTLGEMAKGIERATPAQKMKLQNWFDLTVKSWFESRILEVDENIALTWGKLIGKHKRTLPMIDTLLAATALSYDLTLVTRNTKDFSDIKNLKLLNPFCST